MPGEKGCEELKRILVIDDDEVVLDLISEALYMGGYEVDKARNGIEALKKIEENNYSLILTDIKMPGMDGEELYEKMLSVDSEIAPKVVFTTGDILGMETRRFLEDGKKHYIAKPFGVEELNRVICGILDRRESG